MEVQESDRLVTDIRPAVDDRAHRSIDRVHYAISRLVKVAHDAFVGIATKGEIAVEPLHPNSSGPPAVTRRDQDNPGAADAKVGGAYAEISEERQRANDGGQRALS
jgi:hypothetical protein